MKTRLSKKFWATLTIFSFIGQVAWVVENMYFNVFVYKMFHASARDISLMVAASAVTATVTTLLIGALSDKIGKRKLFICSGYILWGISILSFAFIRMDVINSLFPAVASAAAVGVSLVIIMDCVMTFFGSSANDACFNAWLTDKTDATNRGAAEGINSMMPLVAILAVFGGFMFFNLDQQGSWITIYLIIGTIVVLIGAAGIFLIEEKAVKPDKGQNYFRNILYGFMPSVIKRNPILYATLFAFAVFGIAIQIYMPYLILYYEKSLGLSNYVMIMAPAIILAATITAFYGRLYDRLRFKKSIVPTIAVLMLGFAILYFFRSTGLVFVGSLFMMTGYLTGMAVFGAMIRDYTPVEKVGLFQGLRIFGQVFIPGIVGPAIGAAVLANAKTIVNSDGTRSFIPNEKIFAAAFVAAAFIWILLAVVFHLLRNDHHDYLTPEGEKLGDTPWQEYPRPQLKRDSYLNLNGKWDFKLSFFRKIPENFPRQILVPFPPESILSGIHKTPFKYKYLYYKKQFVIPDGFVKDRVLLHFGAVDQIATVYMNGEEMTTHSGGYLPFTVDITKQLKEKNTVILRVKDTLSHSLPYGKQRRKRGGMWYTPVSGIWQTVWMESVSDDYIKALKITPTLDSVTIHADSAAKEKELIIQTPDGIIRKIFSCDEITVPIDHPVHWTPENPFLYEFEIKTANDRITSYFALRTLAIGEQAGVPCLCLNEKPYYFHGVLDQGYYSDGLYLPASADGYRNDIITMKELGFNTLRKHLKIEPAWYYHLCDTLGMVVFQDMLNFGHYSYIKDTVFPTLIYSKFKDTRFIRTKAVKRNFIRHAQETIQYLYNSPCICLWTIFNEGWGQFDSDKIYEIVKQADNTRFVNSTSGWFHQKSSDVSSLHLYFKPIAAKSDGRPVVLSEFGGYSCKLPEHAYNMNRTYGYRFYADSNELQKALREVYTNEVAAQRKNGLCASVYTQVSDVEDETNGFLTYDRQVLKVDKEEMNRIAEKLKREI